MEKTESTRTVEETRRPGPDRQPTAEEKNRAPAWWRRVALLSAILAILILSKAFGLGDRLGELRQWISTLGPWGPVVFIFLYAAATVAALPGSAIFVAAGALYRSVLGSVVVSVASTLGATLSFLVGRYFARDAVVRWLENNEKFTRLDRLTEEHGAIIVALTRLVPIFPFNLLNYGFGLTRVSLGTYVFWSWLCMLPGTILYVVGADAVTRALAEGRIPWNLMAVVGLSGLVLFFLVRRARSMLRQRETETEAEAVNAE